MKILEAAAIMMLADIGQKIIATSSAPSKGRAKPLSGLSDADFSLIQEFAASGDLWAIQWKYSVIPADQETKNPIVAEVADIFAMWDHVRDCHGRLEKKDQNVIKMSLAASTSLPFDGKFRGFDYTNEHQHAHVASVLIEKLGEFQYMKIEGCKNSHMEILPRYRSMLGIYQQRVRKSGASLGVQDLIDILSAK